MTLIIGCITKEFAIIAGDSQVTNNSDNPGYEERYTKIKTHLASVNFMYGIFGEWTTYHEDVKDVKNDKLQEKKKYKRYDHDTLLIKRLYDFRIDDKKDFVKNYFKNIEYDGGLIYIENQKDKFELDFITNGNSNDVLKKIEFNKCEFLFNECYHNLKSNYVEEEIKRLVTEKNLKSNIIDTIFLLNNLLLKLISNGKKVFVDNGKDYFSAVNTVGGYVTMKIMMIKHLNQPINLSLIYRRDKNSLLDRSTNPFSELVFNNKSIIYLDNLAMLYKNFLNAKYYNHRKYFLVMYLAIKKQINYLLESNIVGYNILDTITKNMEKKSGTVFFKARKENSNEPDFDLSDLSEDFQQGINSVDINYLSRFFE